MEYRTLIRTDDLAACLGDPRLVVVDCRFDLKNVEWGAQEFAAAHIPGARYAHLDRDLSGTKTGMNGRHPLPDPAAFAGTLGRLGISNDSQVVVYDQDAGSYASRLWWMLRWLGHDRAAVLDGGWAKWISERRPTASGTVTPGAAQFEARVRPELLATIDQVIDPARHELLLDARAAERYSGQVELLDKAAGHIPGAAHYFYMDNLGENGTFRPGAELASKLSNATGGARGSEIICYCGSGVTACHNLLALEVAGIHGARLYAGSWSEYSADPSRPVATTEK